MSRKCPSCGFDSADDAAWCDFCKEPFVKKAKAAAPPAASVPPAPAAPSSAAVSPSPAVAPALAGLTKEQVDQLAVDSFLKADIQPTVGAPTWLRPLAWVAFAVSASVGTAALLTLQHRYRDRIAPPGAGTAPALNAAPQPPSDAPTRVE